MFQFYNIAPNQVQNWHFQQHHFTLENKAFQQKQEQTSKASDQNQKVCQTELCTICFHCIYQKNWHVNPHNNTPPPNPYFQGVFAWPKRKTLNNGIATKPKRIVNGITQQKSETTILMARNWDGPPTNSQVATRLTLKTGRDGHHINSYIYIYT